MIEFINEYFRSGLTLVATCFAIYFSFKKIGHNITASIEIDSGATYETFINQVTLNNKKDKVIAIWSVNAIFDNDLKLELIKCEPPIILKPYESLSLSMEKYSKLSVNGCITSIDFYFSKIDIVIDSGETLIKCKVTEKRDLLSDYNILSKGMTKFQNHIYNDKVKYIISYYYFGNLCTAFILGSGLIVNEWEFQHKLITIDTELDLLGFETFLKQTNLSDFVKGYMCFKCSYPDLKLIFEERNIKT
ncbi:hypothetical protein [Aliivibrio fischeri]|uniref:Uncharacterized protein n=1 Tax=Aliivibrio fischeri SR5 TaxID=1088719 RepID=A0AAV3EMX0_ALIFS|nr:hypothetical protein [Aliivibrio fischeri]EHN67974.1 hypothetical protein VFSR5_2699 [Aliivibrio fischeri SR5]